MSKCVKKLHPDQRALFLRVDRSVSLLQCSSTTRVTRHLAGVQGGAGGPVPAPARGEPALQAAHSPPGRQDQKVRYTKS